MAIVSASQSAFLSFTLFVLDLSLLQIFAAEFRSSELMTVVGGFVSSLLFVTLLVFFSNLVHIFSPDSNNGWGEVLFALFIALIAAATVHRVCITTCFLFSVAALAFLNKASKLVYKPKNA